MPAQGLHRTDEEGIYLHIYNKGVEERIIFNDDEDYEVFLNYLRDYLTAPKDPDSTKKVFKVNGHTFRGIPHQPKNYCKDVELIAYALMPDHFHLLLHQVTRGSLEKFIRSLCTRYSIYFNKKYNRAGSLFAGPYKSVHIKNDLSLPYLTRYFHQAGGYSSYQEYIGSRKTSWVKPQVVLSLLKIGEGEYKDFVEKDELDEKQNELVTGIIIDKEVHLLERRDLTGSENEDKNNDSDLIVRSRLPEILAVSSIMFFVLFGLGLRNIMVSGSSSALPLPIPIQSRPTPAVLGTENTESTEDQSEPTPEITPQVSQEALKEILTVKTEDAFSSVNIRQEPSTDSAKLGKASDGDSFEFVSKDEEWYEVKLPDGQVGFISAKYIKEGGVNN